jgi:hypothetical protein
MDVDGDQTWKIAINWRWPVSLRLSGSSVSSCSVDGVTFESDPKGLRVWAAAEESDPNVFVAPTI